MSERIGEYSLEQLTARAGELFAIKGLARQISRGPFAAAEGLYVVRLLAGYIREPRDIEEPMEVVPPAIDRYSLIRTQLVVGRTQYLLKGNKFDSPSIAWTPGISQAPRNGPNTSLLQLTPDVLVDLADGLMQGEPFDPRRHIIREDADGVPHIIDRSPHPTN